MASHCKHRWLHEDSSDFPMSWWWRWALMCMQRFLWPAALSTRTGSSQSAWAVGNAVDTGLCCRGRAGDRSSSHVKMLRWPDSRRASHLSPLFTLHTTSGIDISKVQHCLWEQANNIRSWVISNTDHWQTHTQRDKSILQNRWAIPVPIL